MNIDEFRDNSDWRIKMFAKQIYLTFLHHFFTFFKENATIHNRLIFTKIIERAKI